MVIGIAATITPLDQRWLLDLGSKETLSGHKADFIKYKEVLVSEAFTYRAVTGERVVCRGRGIVLI
jgi:hypothetical protein